MVPQNFAEVIRESLPIQDESEANSNSHFEILFKSTGYKNIAKDFEKALSLDPC